jgi:hypothetical protein
MDEYSTEQGGGSTLNSRLLPVIFDPPRLVHGVRKIPEPRGQNRRPKSGDFKLLAAYVAAYVGQIIPPQTYTAFVSVKGEKAWKRTLRIACDMQWRVGEDRDFRELNTFEYAAMRDYVATAYPFAAKHYDGAWLIKWALRTTWANKRKAAIRAERCTSKQI